MEKGQQSCFEDDRSIYVATIPLQDRRLVKTDWYVIVCSPIVSAVIRAMQVPMQLEKQLSGLNGLRNVLTSEEHTSKNNK